MSWYLQAWKKYGIFSGRSQRSEYWYFALFNAIIAFLLVIIGGASHTGMLLFWMYCVAALIPSVAAAIRRLHDTSHSGWWILLGVIPIIGPIVLLVFYATDSAPETNAYGPSPRATALAL